jgi:hypothetical protein
MAYNYSSPNKPLPYSGNYHYIPNGECSKHLKRVQDIDKIVKKNMSDGKCDTYKDEAIRLTLVQAKKITDKEKAYGRYLVAEEHGFYDIAGVFLSRYKLLNGDRSERIKGLLDDL